MRNYDPYEPANRNIRQTRRRDGKETELVASRAWMGFALGGVIGAVAGLIVSLVPGLGIAWWGGLAIGFLVGVTLGGFVIGRMALEDVDGEAYGNVTRRRTGNGRNFRPR